MEEARVSMKRWGSNLLGSIGSGRVVAKDMTELCKSHFKYDTVLGQLCLEALLNG